MWRINTYDYDWEYITFTTDWVYAWTFFYRNWKFSITNICWLIEINDNFKDKLNIKYLYYFLKHFWRDYANKYSTWRYKLYKWTAEKINISFPNLDTQLKIVNLLDNLTYWITNSNKYLETENINRSKQFKFYLDLILSKNVLEFNNWWSINESKLWKLVDFFNWKCVTFKELEECKKNWTDKFPVYNWWVKEMWYYDKYNEQKWKVTMSKCWASILSLNFTSTNSWISNHDMSFRIKDYSLISDKYLYYFLLSRKDFIKKNMTYIWIFEKLDTKKFKDLYIYLPSIEIQNKIVNILDTFNEYINWLTNNKTWLSNLINLNNKLLKFYLETLIK